LKKTGKILTLGACVLLVGALAARADDAKAAKKTAKPAASPMVSRSAADYKWTDMGADTPGIQFVDLWGDHTKGAFGMLVKFPAGTDAPLHSHTNNMRVVVVSGTFIHTPEGKAAIRLGPGSYLMQPGHGYKHVTGCDKASECIIFTESSGAFDMLPAEAKK